MKIICLPFLFQLDFSNLCRSARTHTAPFCLRGNSGLKNNCNREFIFNLHEASYKKPKIYIDKVPIDPFHWWHQLLLLIIGKVSPFRNKENACLTFGWPTQNENSQISKLMTKTDRSSYNLNIFDIFKVF